jgi:hypothetical protein
MDKVIVVPEKVEDLYGLYMDLRKSEFAVKNVGLDKDGTHVYIDEKETKDPVPLVRSWIGKEPPEVTASLKKKRIREYEELLEKERVAEEKRKAAEAELAAKAQEEALAGSSNTLEMGDTPVAFQDGEGNVIGELIEGDPVTEAQDIKKEEGFFSKIWKKLF